MAFMVFSFLQRSLRGAAPGRAGRFLLLGRRIRSLQRTDVLVYYQTIVRDSRGFDPTGEKAGLEAG